MDNPSIGSTVPGIGPGGWDSGKLARDQETHAIRARARAFATVLRQTSTDYDNTQHDTPADTRIVYRLYTEHADNLLELTERYLDGATLTMGIGLWKDETGRVVREVSRVIEVIGTRDDLQRIVHLAGDIRVSNRQSSVLVTWHEVSMLNIGETEVAS